MFKPVDMKQVNLYINPLTAVQAKNPTILLPLLLMWPHLLCTILCLTYFCQTWVKCLTMIL